MDTRRRVMFVDDEEGVRHSWERYLSDRGHLVRTAADGGAAMEGLETEPADVVIADLRMPGVDGLQLLEWIRQRYPNTRFILFTGYGSQDVEARARSLGAYEYVEKPISPDQLASIVAAALREAPETVPEAPPEPAPTRKRRGRLATLGLLAVAPFLGLAYVVFLPLVGFGMLGYLVTGRIRQALGRT